ncbi:MAG: type II toxin-antitoxin system PemK/MazF family toxin [Anaerolineales bacterium]|nr:type II toxin-antitoxin system PemK/MazF family toxin [Anaerolineales bacterium]
MEITQGDIFWISPNEINKIESDYPHPHVIIQVNADNEVTICAITSSMKRAKEIGHVLLDEGEANLPKQSVIVVSKIYVIDASQLGEYIGRLTEQRINQVLAGISFLEKTVKIHCQT